MLFILLFLCLLSPAQPCRVAVLGDSMAVSIYQPLKEFASQCGALVDNYAVSGESSTKVLHRTHADGCCKCERELVCSFYDVVVVMVGINDIYFPDRVVSNIGKICVLASVSHARVILVTLLPCGSYKNWTFEMQYSIERVNKAIVTLGRKHRVVNAYPLFLNESKREHLKGEYSAADGMHLSTKGANVLASEVFKVALEVCSCK